MHIFVSFWKRQKRAFTFYDKFTCGGISIIFAGSYPSLILGQKTSSSHDEKDSGIEEATMAPTMDLTTLIFSRPPIDPDAPVSDCVPLSYD